MRLFGIEEVVKPVDGEDNLVVVERIVGTILHAQAQWSRDAVTVLHGKGKINLVADLVARDVPRHAIALIGHDKARQQLLQRLGHGQVSPSHAAIAVLDGRVIDAEQGVEC